MYDGNKTGTNAKAEKKTKKRYDGKWNNAANKFILYHEA